MFLVEQLLKGAVLPGVVCLAVLLAAWQPWRGGEKPLLALFAPLAIAVGFFSGFFALLGMPGLPPPEAESWTVWLALTAGLAGLLFGKLPRGLQQALALLLSAAASWLILKPQLTNGVWTSGKAALWIIGIALLIVIGWLALAGLANMVEGPVLPIALCIAATGVSFALLMTHSAKLAQLAGVLAAVCAAATLVALFAPRVAASLWFAGAGWLTLGGLLLAGHFYSELPVKSVGLLAFAPLMPWFVSRLLAHRGAWVKLALAAAITALPVLGALGLIHFKPAADAGAASESDAYYEDYYN